MADNDERPNGEQQDEEIMDILEKLSGLRSPFGGSSDMLEGVSRGLGQGMTIINQFLIRESDFEEERSPNIIDTMMQAAILRRILDPNRMLGEGKNSPDLLTDQTGRNDFSYQIIPDSTLVEVADNITDAKYKKLNVHNDVVAFIHVSLAYSDDWKFQLRNELIRRKITTAQYVIVSLQRKSKAIETSIYAAKPFFTHAIEQNGMKIKADVSIPFNYKPEYIVHLFRYANGLSNGEKLFYIEEFDSDEEYLIDEDMPVSEFRSEISIFPSKFEELHTNSLSNIYKVNIDDEKKKIDLTYWR